MRKRPSTSSRSSALPAQPTTDVEEIARAKAVDFCEKQGLREAFIGEDLRRAMLTVAIQARAPLVEAIERMLQCHILYCEQCSGPDDGCDQGARLEEIKLAALTGTGENLSPEGPVTTNKKETNANVR